MQEQRQFRRRKAIGRIEVLASDGSCSHIGSLFDISDSGVMIGTPAEYVFPKPVFIRLYGSVDQRLATVAWQSPGLAGLIYTDQLV